MKTRLAPGVLIAVNKPKGITSHDAVARVKHALGPYKVGHAGTLDPLAGGVLVLGIAQATKILGELASHAKTYRASVVFGAATTTDDAEGEVIYSSSVPDEYLSYDFAQKEILGLIGEHIQTPPAYSAISIRGKRAYEYARKGLGATLPKRHIDVYDAHLLRVLPDDKLWEFDIAVSGGTYIRSLARDLGEKLGCGAHLGNLLRLESFGVGLESCISFDEIAKIGLEGLYSRALDPLACLGLPSYTLDDIDLQHVMTGTAFYPKRQRFSDPDAASPSPLGLIKDGSLWGIWKMRADRLVCIHNYPLGIKGVSA